MTGRPERGGAGRPAGGVRRPRPEADSISRGDAWRRAARRARSWLLCRVGRHTWAVRRNPEVGGPRAVYQQCRRCGRERTDWALRGTFED